MNIGVWGDSITYGGSTEGWVRLLRVMMAPRDTNVYNRGICNDASDDVLRRFGVEAGAISPHTVMFAVGANDSKWLAKTGKVRVPLERYEANMRELVSQTKSVAGRIILISPTDVDETIARSSGNRFSNETIGRYAECLKRVARDEGVEYAEMRGVLDVHRDLEDGVHPNEVGYEKMFAAISAFFK